MSEGENDSGIPEEDTVIHNLPLYTERKASGIKLTTGLGSGSMWKGKGWGRFTLKKYRTDPVSPV